MHCHSFGHVRVWALSPALVGLLLLGSSGLLSAGEKKAAIPSTAAQAKVEELIQEVFGEEYAKARKDSAARAQLAATLLQQGKDSTDDIAARYVLFREARILAAQAGDASTALRAADELAKEFDIAPAEVLRIKIQALFTASKVVTSPEAYHTVVDNALVLLQEALAADDYEAAQGLAAAADAAARKLKNVALVSSIRKRQEEVQAGKKQFAPWKPFADALAKDPTDPKANLEMGRYQALLKGNWDKGLPLLARGSAGALKNLAVQDLAEPKDASQQAALAEQWLEQAAKAKGKMGIHLLLRAYHWDVQAMAGLEGDARARVDKQMEWIREQLPPEYREIVAEIRTISGHGSPVYAVAFSPDGRRAVSGGADNGVHLWDTATGKEIRRLDGHSGRVWAVAFAPDGRRVASAGFDGSIRLWDLAGGVELRRLPGHNDYVRSIVFSHNGRYILSGGDDRLVRLCFVDSDKDRSFTGHNHFVWSVALSRDGKRALSASLDRTVRLWDVATGKKLLVLKGHKDTVLSVAFSPDGKSALSGSTDKTLKLWDLETGKPIRTFTGHTGYVHSVAFSPDGRRALSAGQDRMLILWDVHTGKEVRRLEGHRDMVWSVAFSHDGRQAISGGQDGTIRIWGPARDRQASSALTR